MKNCSAEEIVAKSYEMVMKEELCTIFYPENNQYNINQIKALNKMKYPLQKLLSHSLQYTSPGIRCRRKTISRMRRMMKKSMNENTKPQEIRPSPYSPMKGYAPLTKNKEKITERIMEQTS